jgi:hypothetical protein
MEVMVICNDLGKKYKQNNPAAGCQACGRVATVQTSGDTPIPIIFVCGCF